MADTEKRNSFDEEEFLKKIEKAAGRGAGRNRIFSLILQVLPVVLILGFLYWKVYPQYTAFNEKIDSILHVDDPAEDHDVVLDDDGGFGYTAADFADAVLGDQERLKKLEVYSVEISDVGTITDTGLLNLGIFTKNQLITYNGIATYTVDLGKVKSGDILLDVKERTVTLRIPHAEREEINIPEDRIQFGNTTGGLLAFGEVKMTPEQAAQVQAEAREKMEARLEEQDVARTADRFARLSVWEIYHPVIRNVSKECSLEVEFR